MKWFEGFTAEDLQNWLDHDGPVASTAAEEDQEVVDDKAKDKNFLMPEEKQTVADMHKRLRRVEPVVRAMFAEERELEAQGKGNGKGNGSAANGRAGTGIGNGRREMPKLKQRPKQQYQNEERQRGA
jgi:hypothetical protein